MSEKTELEIMGNEIKSLKEQYETLKVKLECVDLERKEMEKNVFFVLQNLLDEIEGVEKPTMKREITSTIQ